MKKSLSPLPSEAPSDYVQFKALQYALFVTCFVEVIGGIFFLVTAIYIVRDKQKVDNAIAGSFLYRTFFIVKNICMYWFIFLLTVNIGIF